jgi:hypothetical protein
MHDVGTRVVGFSSTIFPTEIVNQSKAVTSNCRCIRSTKARYVLSDRVSQAQPHGTCEPSQGRSLAQVQLRCNGSVYMTLLVQRHLQPYRTLYYTSKFQSRLKQSFPTPLLDATSQQLRLLQNVPHCAASAAHGSLPKHPICRHGSSN